MDSLSLSSSQRDRLSALGALLVDQQRARVIVPPQRSADGYWFGGGNLAEGPDGAHYLCGRFRNAGDSRTGLGVGERGLELALFRSADGCRSFQKILSLPKSVLTVGDHAVVSIEGSALQFTPAGVRLFVSTEKAGIGYPPGLQEYHKPGTGVWTIDLLEASEIAGLSSAPIRTILVGDEPEVLHVKDPFLYRCAGEERLGFCTHPFTWASSNTAFARETSPGVFAPSFAVVPRGAAWDVAITRVTSVVPVPRVGVFEDRDWSLVFYDGGECMRRLDEHGKAARRPRGYSCEELGGLAVIAGGDFDTFTRLSRIRPAFVSPWGSGCSRYVDVCWNRDRILVTWQQGQEDGSQPLVLNEVPVDAVEAILRG
ncbi:MAG: exo-alpha-sialidase [Spirochaetaceae bacterium]|nr:MAG: exo-alpha-sialidase [Spirochaetaceae bacterium]